MMVTANRQQRQQSPRVLGSVAPASRCAYCREDLAGAELAMLRMQPPEDPQGQPVAFHTACWLAWRTDQVASQSA